MTKVLVVSVLLLVGRVATAAPACTGYAVFGDTKDAEIVTKEEVERWARYALTAEAKYDAGSVCEFHVMVMSVGNATVAAVSYRQYSNGDVILMVGTRFGLSTGSVPHRKQQVREVIEASASKSP